MALLSIGLVAGLARALADGDAPAAEPAKVQPAPNPHWNDAGCATCHGPGEPKKIAPADADKLCLSCHDGKRALLETHPVGRPLDAEQFNQPPGWPLTDGRIGCLSCHNPAREHCRRGQRRPMLNPMFLRGLAAGGVVNAFCSNCHRLGNYQKLNPHVQRDESGVLAAKCGFCHGEAMSAQAKVRTGYEGLHRPQVELCRGCHPTHIEYFNPGHVGQKLSPTMLARVKPLADLVGPAPGGQIACSTCHNPHEAGVFPLGSEMNGPTPLRAAGPDKIIASMNPSKLCSSCHEMARGAGALKVEKGPEDANAPVLPEPPLLKLAVCPVDDRPLGPDAITATVRGQRITFCSRVCMRKFQTDPDACLLKIRRMQQQAPTTQPQSP
ncbi:MAG: hypothetical protein BIFFINMI_03156 [Phycisphaerae bacterium]|nr:hypothetical protein [Phycisphaerae bacterium]